MTPSEESPGPGQGKLLSDLIRLLEQDPEALQELKGRLDATAAVKPSTPGKPSPVLPKSLVPAVAPKVQAIPPTVSPSKPAGVSQVVRKTPMPLQAPADVRPSLVRDSPETPTPLQPPAAIPQPARPVKQGVWQKIGGGSLTFAALFHVLLLVIGAFWIFQVIRQPEKKVDFMPSGGGGGERGAKDVSVKKMKQITPTTNLKRVFAEGAKASYAIPEQGDHFGEMSALSSLSGGGMSGGLGGSGLGAGFGKGSGNGAGSALGGAGNGKLFGLTKFGALSGPGLTGYFYDLKQTNEGKPSDILSQGDVNSRYMNVLKDFTKNWDPQILEKYYRGQKPLFAAQIYVTNGPSDDAAKAFGEEKSCSGYQWIVHYKGRCVAPKDGTFRFIGRGDNVMVVRLNDKIVLDGGFDVQTYTVAHEVNTSDNLGPAGPTGWTLAGGAWFKVRRGDVMNLEVLIGDGGGLFSDYLLIEAKGAKYADRKDAPGFPAYPLFQLARTPVPKEAGENGNPQTASQPLVFDVQF